MRERKTIGGPCLVVDEPPARTVAVRRFALVRRLVRGTSVTPDSLLGEPRPSGSGWQLLQVTHNHTPIHSEGCSSPETRNFALNSPLGSSDTSSNHGRTVRHGGGACPGFVADFGCSCWRSCRPAGSAATR